MAQQIVIENITPSQATSANSLPVVIASDQSKVPVTEYCGFQEVVGQGTSVVTGINTDFIPATDVSNYRWLSIQIVGTFSLTLSFQASNDNVNWTVAPLILANTANASPSSIVTATTQSGNMWVGPINYRYFRVRCTAFTSNASLAGNLELYADSASFFQPTINNFAKPNTSGGTSDYHLISAATTNANSVKASAGQVYGWSLGNNGATDAYVKLYNKASAPTVGTDAPLRTIYVPKGQSVQGHTTVGISMGTGIALAITGAAADTDTTAVAAAQVVVELDYA